MLFGAFRPQTTREIESVTDSDQSVAKWRDLLFLFRFEGYGLKQAAEKPEFFEGDGL
jgi:hypothetical protein